MTFVYNQLYEIGIMASDSSVPYSHKVALREYPDRKVWKMLGERDNIGDNTNGEDLWDGTADLIPIPSAAGQQMAVVSTSANDTLAGTGARRLKIEYLDENSTMQFEVVNLNGLTPVLTTATNIAFINNIFVVEPGSVSGAANGIITVYEPGTPTTVYDQIENGSNMSLTARYKVPQNYELLVTKYNCSSSRDKNESIRLRATCDNDGNLTDTFLFKFASFVKNASTGSVFDPPIYIPPLAIIKVTAFGDTPGGEASANVYGYLYKK